MTPEQSPELRAALEICGNVEARLRSSFSPTSADAIRTLAQAVRDQEETIADLRRLVIHSEQSIRDLTQQNAQLIERANFHRDRGITLLDAKYLDPACHTGCKSLVWQQKLAQAEAALAEAQTQLAREIRLRHPTAPGNIEPADYFKLYTETRKQLAEANAARDIYEHMVITCGVIASHPDATLGDRGAYANEWNSKQADDVRALRRDRDKLRASDAAKAEEIERLRKALAYLTATKP